MYTEYRGRIQEHLKRFPTRCEHDKVTVRFRQCWRAVRRLAMYRPSFVVAKTKQMNTEATAVQDTEDRGGSLLRLRAEETTPVCHQSEQNCPIDKYHE